MRIEKIEDEERKMKYAAFVKQCKGMLLNIRASTEMRTGIVSFAMETIYIW